MNASRNHSQGEVELENLRRAAQAPTRKLGRGLALLSLLFVVPLLGAGVWMSIQAERELERSELQRDLLRARMLAALVEQQLISSEKVLQSIAHRWLFVRAWAGHDLRGLERHLRQARELEPAFLFISVHDLDGTRRAILPPDPTMGQNFAHRDWYRGVTQNWQPHVSEVYRTAVGSHPLVVAIAVPIRDEQGKPIGILMAPYELEQLRRKIQALQRGSVGVPWVVNHHSIIVTAPADSPLGEPLRGPEQAAAARALAGQEGSGRFGSGAEESFIGYAPMPKQGWAVLYRRPAQVALAAVAQLRRRSATVGLYLLLIYLITMGIAVMLVRRQGQLLAHNQALNEALDERLTERKRAEEALRRAKDEAERASRFKDQFLSTMSHELRTPLNAVLGFSELLSDERYGTLNDRQRRYLGHIHTGGQHLLKLINDILDLSRIEAGRLELAIEDVWVESAFGEVLSALRPLAEKKSQTLSHWTEPGLAVRADATRFKQALMNLVGNAVKFTPEGGRIEVAARRLDGEVRVEVRDTGPGIPPEERKRIFEAFYRLRQSGQAPEGTGLGLAITQRLIELQDGRLGLESEPGHGSCFHFSLPLAEIVHEEHVHEPALKGRASTPPRILVIEDDPQATQIIQSYLTSAGYGAVACTEPARASHVAADLQPDAITLDILMKPVNGWEVLAQLKNDPRTTRIPVIVITIVDQPAMGLTLGADEYLVKPVEKGALLAAVQRCLRPRRGAPPARPILVVEDDASTREVIAELLTTAGYAVIPAVDGAEARLWVNTSLPDLVLLDLVLPKVSGFELLAEWRADARTADLPVFVLTGKDLSPEEEKYIRAHAESLFRKHKPWQEDLMRQLRRVVPQPRMEVS